MSGGGGSDGIRGVMGPMYKVLAGRQVRSDSRLGLKAIFSVFPKFHEGKLLVAYKTQREAA